MLIHKDLSKYFLTSFILLALFPLSAINNQLIFISQLTLLCQKGLLKNVKIVKLRSKSSKLLILAHLLMTTLVAVKV